jgi:uncharacterized integral membrane protein
MLMIAAPPRGEMLTMSTDRSSADLPGKRPDATAPSTPDGNAPRSGEPTLPTHTIQPTRISMVWTMVGIGVVLLIAILVFILQNGEHVRVRFLWVHGSLPLGVGLLLAAVLGALAVLAIGAARVLQLRLVARRHRRADQLPDGG